MGRNEMVLLRENVYSKSEKRERYYWYSDKFEPVPHIFSQRAKAGTMSLMYMTLLKSIPFRLSIQKVQGHVCDNLFIAKFGFNGMRGVSRTTERASAVPPD